MSNIIKFIPRRRPTRIEAAQWLCLHFTRFPELDGNYSQDLFHGWRFMRGDGDGEIYFGNFVDPAISEQAFIEFLEDEKCKST